MIDKSAQMLGMRHKYRWQMVFANDGHPSTGTCRRKGVFALGMASLLMTAPKVAAVGYVPALARGDRFIRIERANVFAHSSFSSFAFASSSSTRLAVPTPLGYVHQA